ncbi:retrovirus-related pol polyprotein from transposon TNT 1-94 [Tanacetum coccineum]
MKAILRKDKCLAAIGERPAEVTDDSKWDEMDGNAIANLHLALANGVLSSIEEKKTAKDIWDHLARLYEARSLHNRIFLKRKLYALCMIESTSVTEHVIINLTSNVLTDCLIFDNVAAFILEEENRCNNREDRQTSSRQAEALVVTKGRSMEPGSSGSHNYGKSEKGKKNNFKCFKCGKLSHFNKDCRGSNTSKPQGNIASTSDDGATFHMTARREWFHQYKPISRGGSVYSCNDHELKIIRIGSVIVKMHDGIVRTIRDVRHVEGLKNNLLSLGQLDDLGCKVEIQNKIMKVIKGVLVLMKEEKVDANLYQLKGEIREESEASVASHSPSHRVVVSWHRKLGHMLEQGMKILVERKLIPGLTKNWFTLMRCWVYPIKKKSDVFEVFKVYKARVKLDSRTKIKCLRIDNGGEYTEWMNRTLLERERAMLATASLGKSLWAEAVNTACYVINRSPSTAVELKTPIEMWMKKPVNYSDIHIFGSPVETTTIQMEKEFQSNDSSEAVPHHEVNETAKSQAPTNHTLDSERRRPGWQADYVMESNVAYCLLTDEGEPSTFQEALNNPDASFWKEAMQKEIKALHKNKTWELVPLPGGYAQKDGIDFNEIFSPMVRMTTIRVVLAMCATYDLHLEQLDVKTAFLHGNLEEEIYMLQPEGFKQKGKENLVCRLNKSLYSLKQAPQCPNKEHINKLKAQLAREFEMKDLGPTNKILGMQIHRDRPISTPFLTDVKLSSKMSPSSEKERMDMSRVPYASAVGSLMFAMICTRPDIAHAVGVVSWYMAESDLIVTGYVDFDYTGDLDGSKLTTGYMFTLSGRTVSWVSKLQSVVEMSTTEAEYVSSAQASKEAVWLKMLLEELGYKQENITLFCDNQSALYLVRNLTFHSKTKHIRVQYHFIREEMEEGTMDM